MIYFFDGMIGSLSYGTSILTEIIGCEPLCVISAMPPGRSSQFCMSGPTFATGPSAKSVRLYRSTIVELD
jgi:hypothetical protein